MSLDTTAGGATAEAFASVTEYDTYCTAFGITNTDSTTVKEQNLRKGATYLVNQYRDRWLGVRTTETQALPWPRCDGSHNPYHARMLYPLLDLDGFQIGMDVVPVQVKHANIEAALLAKAGTSLEPALDRGGQIKSISKGVGPLSKSITYTDGASTLTRFTKLEGILRGLVTSTPGATSGNVRLVRS